MSTNQGMAFREKYWDEKTDQEKIESLADCVRSLADSHYRLLCKMEEIERHSHDGLGRVTVPLDVNRNSGVYHQWARQLREKS